MDELFCVRSSGYCGSPSGWTFPGDDSGSDRLESTFVELNDLEARLRDLALTGFRQPA